MRTPNGERQRNENTRLPLCNRCRAKKNKKRRATTDAPNLELEGAEGFHSKLARLPTPVPKKKSFSIFSLPRSIESDWLLLGFTGFYRVSLGFFSNLDEVSQVSDWVFVVWRWHIPQVQFGGGHRLYSSDKRDKMRKNRVRLGKKVTR